MEFISEAGKPAIFWMGQAGFLLRSGSGRTLCVDPYLSDCCERVFGFKRLMPHLVQPEKFAPDYLFATHAHYDHFDIDALPVIAKNGKTAIYAAQDARDECQKLGMADVHFIKLHDTVQCGDFNVEAVDCDHGTLAPLAVGLLITVNQKRIYIMGDTALRTDYLRNPKLMFPDLLIAPINGAYGNMNGQEAATAAKCINAKMTIPCHFWNFAEHRGDPQEFADAMQQAKQPYTLLPIGGRLYL